MKTEKTHPRPGARRWAVAPVAIALVAIAVALAVAPAAADDTRLLQKSQQEPYVFFLLDLSGSMNQSVVCDLSDPQYENQCVVDCPLGGCLPRMIGDDPDSRIRSAKEAIYEIMRNTPNVKFGFGAFSHNAMRVYYKHFWYRVQAGQTLPTFTTGHTWPLAGQEEIFGKSWACDEARNDSGTYAPSSERYAGCRFQNAAHVDDAWDYERVRRWPKLGDGNNEDKTIYVRDTDGTIYQIQYIHLGLQTLGAATVQVRIRVKSCTSASSCSDVTGGDRTVVFEKVDEMVYWEPGEGVQRNAPGVAFFGSQGGVRQVDYSGQSPELEPNNDESADTYSSVDLKQARVADPSSRGEVFSTGDRIFFDWKNDHRLDIMKLMAPNLNLPGQTVPDFQIATYLSDHPNGSGILTLKDTRARPLISRGGTPTGGAMQEFLNQLNNWETVAAGSNGDSSLFCRSAYLVVVTDGLASDGRQACDVATNLRQNTLAGGQHYPVRSFSVGFGRDQGDYADEAARTGRDDVLNCIADNGGTGATDHDGDGNPDGPGPFYPKNRAQLVQAFTSILTSITPGARSFAAAAVPSVQANVQDKVFLSSFVPDSTHAIWPGRMDAFVRPVPYKQVPVYDENGMPVLDPVTGEQEIRFVPDRGRRCSSTLDKRCLLWDGGEQLVAQSPADAFIDPLPAYWNWNLGQGATQRRMFFSRRDAPAFPQTRLPFQPPEDSDTATWQDLLVQMGICPDPATPSETLAVCVVNPVRRARVVATMRLLHELKQFEDPENPGTLLPYVLGDIFHTDPVVVESPRTASATTPPICTATTVAASNPDPATASSSASTATAGRCSCWAPTTASSTPSRRASSAAAKLDDHRVEGDFDDGTGRELFSFIPRSCWRSSDR